MLKHISFIAILFFVVFTYAGKAQNPATCCDFPGWQFYQPLTITNASANPVAANTPYILYMNTLSLVSAGTLQANGNDLRILSSPCGAAIPYCIESGINTAQTEIWISLPAIAANSSVVVYVYYGNPAAPSGSNCGTFFATSLTVSSNQTLSGIQNYDKITVNAGVTVSMNSNQPLVFNAKKISILGNINGDFKGYGPALGPGAGTSGFGTIGGGGGSYGGKGGAGGVPNNSGPVNGTSNGPDIDMGSGGGASDCPASTSGGGAFTANALVVDIFGSISMNGQNATGCAPNIGEAEGGGSGGGVLLQGIYLNGTGSISCKGGNGGNSINMEPGGGGGGGRVKRFYTLSNGGGLNIDVTPGIPGVGGIAIVSTANAGTNPVILVPGITYGFGGELPISPVPVVAFSTPGGLCENSNATFTDNSTVSIGTIQAWDWNFGALGIANSGLQNPTVPASNCGQVTVTLTAISSGGCSATSSQNLTVTGLPSVSFTNTQPCLGLPVDFTETVTFTGGCNDTYTIDYDFGDGSIVQTGSNLSHLYPAGQAGPFNVTVTATTPTGCSSSNVVPVSLLPLPNVSFNMANNPECEGVNVNFQGTTTISAPANILSHLWDFGDGTPTSISQNEVHAYANAGNYTVTLTETSNQNCIASLTQQITINANPIPNFSSDIVCENSPTTFTDLTGLPGLNYNWSMPSPAANYNIPNPQHTFSSALGSPYAVTMTVTDANGCTGTYTGNVDVTPFPIADFGVQDVCFPNPAVFVNTSTGTGLSYTWDYGDGNFSVLSNPSRVYASAGTYTVTLVASVGTCFDQITKDVTIFPKPTADYTRLPSIDDCQGTQFDFFDISTVGGAAVITARDWDFGEPPISGLQSPSHIYNLPNPNPGYAVSLIATSSDGCKDTLVRLLPVFPLPVASFQSTNICDGIPMLFESSSTISSGSITNYDFDFGDNTPNSNLDTVSHLYATSGTYAVVYTVTSDQNCISTLTKPIDVFPIPQSDFIGGPPTEGCVPLVVPFRDNSSPSGPPHQVVSWVWYMGNGTVYNGAFPNVNPNPETYDTGTYTPSLVVTSIDGCTDSIAKVDEVIVHPLPIAGLVTDPEREGILNPFINFINTSSGWENCDIDFGDGFVSNILSSVGHTYEDTGLYRIFLTATTEFGCRDTISRYVTILPEYTWYVPNAFTPNYDLKNETWGGKGMATKTYELQIFNRWGEEIFRSKNPEENWDGTIRDFGSGVTNIIKQDIYVYKINILDNNDLRHIYTGKLYVYPDTDKKIR